MPTGVVRAESDRPLTVHAVRDWQPGADVVNLRAAVTRNGRVWPLLVKLVSRGRDRAFVKFDAGGTGWVPLDDLMES